ncbi:TIR domain-containing protein [Patescibacteria group bacterium]|nr:TIR domain-containing protein [Patescibacteria group bacterium]
MNYYRTPKTKVFISFDFDHDEDLKNLFVGQAKHDDTPFEITDISVKQILLGDWKAKVRTKIRNAEQVVVICGEYTHTATGVSAEVEIAQELNRPYFLLKGRSDKNCTKPKSAKDDDEIYKWTWEKVDLLLRGNR